MCVALVILALIILVVTFIVVWCILNVIWLNFTNVSVEFHEAHRCSFTPFFLFRPLLLV